MPRYAAAALDLSDDTGFDLSYRLLGMLEGKLDLDDLGDDDLDVAFDDDFERH